MEPAPTQMEDEAPDLPCPHCGYNLHGIDSARCPECGTEIDRANLAVSRIPWVHRRQIGRVAAFIRTTVAFTFRTPTMAIDVGPPDYRAAVRFRAAVVTVASAAIILPIVLWRWLLYEPRRGIDIAILDDPAMLGLLLASVPLVLAACTGIPLYFFRPRGLSPIHQARAISMAQYACAPLAWTWITVIPVALYVWLGANIARHDTALLTLALAAGFVSALLVISQAFLWWRGTLVILGRTALPSTARSIACGVLTPIMGVIAAVIIPALLVLIANFLTIVAVSVFGR